MIEVLDSGGFLGTPASFGADLSLVVTTCAAVLVTIGWRLVARQSFTAHHWVQITATALNSAVVLLWMVSSLARTLVPGLPSILAEPPYALTAVHALTGTIGLLLGVYIIVRFSGSSPRRLRRLNAGRTMRRAFALYLLTWLLGLGIYLTYYTNLIV